jgi:Ca-activated chloride channel family protein
MMDEFLHPERLWLLVGLLLLAAAYIAVLRWRRAATVRFTRVDLLDRIAPQRPSWRRHVVASMQLLGLAAGIVAIARPITTTVERTVSEGRIILALDVSLSMEATDVAPDRLAAAQQTATEFVGHVAEDIEIGLISFCGVVAVEVPPTVDRAALAAGISGLGLCDRTAIGDALIQATNMLQQLQRTVDGGASDDEQITPGAIVLLTDGERTVGAFTDDAARTAGLAGIPVFTIAFGTADGVIVEADGDVIPVPVKPEALDEVAELTGGQAYEAGTASELADAYARIEALLGETLGDAIEVVTERTWVWAGGAVATLAAAWALSLWWLRGMV